MTAADSNYKWLRISSWCVALTLGVIEAWATRFTMNPDGVSYLDMGDAYWRGDWHMAINAYWSPLYSWILGFFLKVLKPSMYWEYPVVHLVNFLIYVAALASFEFFLSTFIADRKQHDQELLKNGQVGLSESSWWLLGYSLFIPSSIILITLHLVTPDMCVAAFVYLASALILKMRNGTATRRTYIILGIVLGFAYLAKAVMFPLGFVFLLTALFAQKPWRESARNVVSAGLVFLAIGSPFIAAISSAKGRPTTGDVARVAYEIYIDAVDVFIPNSAGAKHPVQRILDKPLTYEFAMPTRATYPLWYDPSYWHEGVKPFFDMRGQARAIGSALLLYSWLLFTLQLNTTAALLALLLIAPHSLSCCRRAVQLLPLAVPGLSALALYSLVYAEPRYVAPFFILLWLAAFSGLSFPNSLGMKRFLAFAVMAIAATTLFRLSAASAFAVIDGRKAVPTYSLVASALAESGLKAGDKVAVVGKESFGEGGAFIARLARAQIIVETEEVPAVWTANPSAVDRFLDAARSAGIKAILSYRALPSNSAIPAQHVAGTDYQLYLLEPSVCCNGFTSCLPEKSR